MSSSLPDSRTTVDISSPTQAWTLDTTTNSEEAHGGNLAHQAVRKNRWSAGFNSNPNVVSPQGANAKGEALKPDVYKDNIVDTPETEPYTARNNAIAWKRAAQTFLSRAITADAENARLRADVSALTDKSAYDDKLDELSISRDTIYDDLTRELTSQLVDARAMWAPSSERQNSPV